MIYLVAMVSFPWSLPALQSVTLTHTMLTRKPSLLSAKVEPYLGKPKGGFSHILNLTFNFVLDFLQRRLSIYYHLFTQSEGRSCPVCHDLATNSFSCQDCHPCAHPPSLLLRHHLHHPRQLLRYGGARHRVSSQHSANNLCHQCTLSFKHYLTLNILN